LKQILFDTVFHADAEYDIYIAQQLTSGGENLDLQAEFRPFRP
jgi:hypothetical protein